MGLFGQFASFSQFFLYGRKHCTKTGYEQARKALLKKGPDMLETADATGKVYIVTGANSGVGKELSLYLATKGATVHMICRSASRGEAAREDIVQRSGNAQVVLHVCDCSLEADVRATWDKIAGSTAWGGHHIKRLDGLVCNAGVLLHERTLTAEGVETTFACHLLFGTYLLGSLAMPLLEATQGARLVAVSSGGMYNTKFPDWGVATAEEGSSYSGNLAYAYAKRGQVLLCERWSALHPSVKFVSCHPGWVQTPAVDAAYGADGTKKYLEPLRSPWEGADGIAWLCVADAEDLEGGAFYLDRKAEPKHLAGPFFTEGTHTKNAPADVDLMMSKLEQWADGESRRGGPTAQEEGKAARAKPLKEMASPIEIEAFMGRWYVIAAIPTLLDRGAVNSVEEYAWNADKQRIDVSFRFQPKAGAPLKEVLQRATIVNGASSAAAASLEEAAAGSSSSAPPNGVNTRWALKPAVGGVFLPLNLAYLVVDCAADYSTTIIGVPDRSILYVMARTPKPEEPIVGALLEKCTRLGFDPSKIVRVEHDETSGLPQPSSMPVPRSLPGQAFRGPARLCMATMSPSHNGGSAKRVMDAITEAGGNAYATWFATFPRGASSPYYEWIELLKAELPKEQKEKYASRHGWSAPFVWIEQPDGSREAIGGRDALCKWALAEFPSVPAICKAADAPLRYMDAFVSLSKPGSAAPIVYESPECKPTPPTAELLSDLSLRAMEPMDRIGMMKEHSQEDVVDLDRA